MKFSHSLQFNSVPDWADRYIAYSNLKKLVYQIERDIIVAPTSQANDVEAIEESPLLDLKSRANAIFIPALDKELTKINVFYLSKEDELFKEVTALIQDFAVFENLEDSLSIRSNSHSRSNSFSLSRSHQSHQSFDGISRHNSKASGSRHHRLSTSESYISNASSDEDEPSTPIAKRQSVLWRPSTIEEQRIHLKKRTIDLFVWLSELKSFVVLNRTGFSKILKKYDKITNGDLKTSYLNGAVNDTYLFKASTLKNLEDQILKIREIYANICTNADMDAATRELKTHLREFIVWERNTVWRDIIGLERKSQAVIPIFVTSLLVPLLVVCLRVLPSDVLHLDNSASKAAHHIFSAMFSPVIMLLLGGFAIAGALSKYHVAKMMATVVLAKAGTRPSNVLLVSMFVATFSSMWISNVAAPVLCLSLIQPILRNLPQNSSFGRCLILGIALASNVGGMASPISSPQNIIAIEYMNPSPNWISWFFIAIPLCFIVNILIWLLLLFNYKPSGDSLSIHPIRLTKDPWSETQIFVIVITVITIALWCVEKQLEDFFGDMGVIAIIPLVAFFGTGILTKEDFNNFLWTVIILAMGGIALGAAVRDSGLLHTIAQSVKEMSGDLTVWQILVLFGSLVLVMATFISHTVAALIILPIVAQLNEQHSNLLVMGSALICSIAMGLPVSGFPNMNAIMMEDEMGVRYLNTIDFIKSGIPGSFLGLMSIATVGYLLMSLIGY
ncbi:SPX-domain-containing protein [Gigaspora margarita]|uniref:SPX-domain-containing protein n=1 Tax=Gigaspora margarita TaxID=4874 RepID=A0A8H4EN19_GIGMA|nr:SPX-domain-containing protein [Gigaspora margarita]